LIVSFDCEGVNLGRLGTVTLVTVAIPGPAGGVFHFDLLPSAPFLADSLAQLKLVLESTTVLKVIHDSKNDADVLQGKGIHVNHVFDTLVGCQILCGVNKNLNDALAYFDCKVNTARGSIDYDSTPRYWEARPLTPAMLEYAAGDVAELFELYTEQQRRLTSSGKAPSTWLVAMEAQLDRARGCPFHFCILVPDHKKGRVIGKGGANLRDVESRSGASLQANRQGGFLILGRTQAIVDAAKRMVQELMR